jgi:oligopeptide transport system substrate-binding protein
MKKRNMFRGFAAVSLSVLMFAGCGTTQPPASPNTGATESSGAQSNTPTGTTVEQKLAFNITPVPTMDPTFFNAAPSSTAIKPYAEGLINVYLGELQPGVADTWEVADDFMSMTFHLRDGACWADGTPLTANDFVYSFRRLADPNNAATYSWALAEIVNGEEIAYGPLNAEAAAAEGKTFVPLEELGVSAPDDQTFVIQFDTPAPYYLDLLDLPCFSPVKKELVDQYGAEYATSADKMLGNGPFVVKEYIPDEKVTYVPNENYWNKDAIKLKEVTGYQWSDSTVEFDAYRDGQIQVASIPIAVAPQYLNGSLTLEDSDLMNYMTGAIDWFSINIASETNPILGNKDFRLALNYALDRDEFVAIADNGLYFPATRFVLPMVKGNTEETRYVDEYKINEFPSTADMDKAQQHLQAAMDAMNISDPSEISIALKISDAASAKLIVENAQDQWQRTLGITVTIDIVTYKAQIDDRISGNFDLVYAGWMPDYNDPYTYLGYFMSSNEQNGGKFSSARYDELVSTANNFSEVTERLAMYAEAEQILLDEGGIIPLHVRQAAWVKSSNLKNYDRFFLGVDKDFRYAYFE